MPSTAPPLPRNRRSRFTWPIKCLAVIGVVPALVFGTLVVLAALGLFHPFYIPSRSMAPALSAGDRVAVEGITFLARNPRRGDIVVFKSDGISYLQPGTLYAKRIAGVPGDHLSISGGNLFVDEKLINLSNNVGKIIYNEPPNAESLIQTNIIVRSGCYFLLGDNSTNSVDSRFFGDIPRKEILGRVVFCYWPPSRIGITE